MPSKPIDRLAALARVREALKEIDRAYLEADQFHNWDWSGYASAKRMLGELYAEIALLVSAPGLSRDEAEAEAVDLWSYATTAPLPTQRIHRIVAALLDVDRIAELRHAAREADLEAEVERLKGRAGVERPVANDARYGEGG